MLVVASPIVYADSSVLGRLSDRDPALGRLGMNPADALHLAAALVGGARYAVSCDHHWLRLAGSSAAVLGPTLRIVSPLELVHLEGLP